MRQLAKVTMTMRDLDRLKCIQAVADGNLKPGRAADRLQGLERIGHNTPANKNLITVAHSKKMTAGVYRLDPKSASTIFIRRWPGLRTTDGPSRAKKGV